MDNLNFLVVSFITNGCLRYFSIGVKYAWGLIQKFLDYSIHLVVGVKHVRGLMKKCCHTSWTLLKNDRRQSWKFAYNTTHCKCNNHTKYSMSTNMCSHRMNFFLKAISSLWQKKWIWGDVHLLFLVPLQWIFVCVVLGSPT